MKILAWIIYRTYQVVLTLCGLGTLVLFTLLTIQVVHQLGLLKTLACVGGAVVLIVLALLLDTVFEWARDTVRK